MENRGIICNFRLGFRNKKILIEKDPTVRQQNQEQLRKTAADPILARNFMLRASLINSVRQAQEIQ